MLLNEENNEKHDLYKLMTAIGQEAQMYISRIYQEGAEQVLDEILRDHSEPKESSPRPDENMHEDLQINDKIIYWSKSGVEPFVGVYQIGQPGVELEVQPNHGEEAMEEERVQNIDRQAVESASYFLLRGFDEATVGRVIDDACDKCFETEEALTMVRDLIREDPRLSAYALDEEEEGMYNDYRHSLRKKFMGHNEDVLNPEMYEINLSPVAKPSADKGLVDAPTPQDIGADAAKQRQIADLQAEIADKEAEHAEEMEDLKTDLAKLQDGLFEARTDPNKGSLQQAWMNAGPQGLGNAISQMDDQTFALFTDEITIDGYNLIGRAGDVQEPEADPVSAEPQVDAGAPEPAAPAPEPEQPGDVDLSAL